MADHYYTVTPDKPAQTAAVSGGVPGPSPDLSNRQRRFFAHGDRQGIARAAGGAAGNRRGRRAGHGLRVRRAGRLPEKAQPRLQADDGGHQRPAPSRWPPKTPRSTVWTRKRSKATDFRRSRAGRFDLIVTNPPIRAGKQVIYRMFADAAKALRETGSFWLVVRKQQGAPSAVAALQALFQTVDVLSKKGGYWVIRCGHTPA